MTAQFFVDTNILLYAASNAPGDQVKRKVARDVLTQPALAFSAQVIQEFYVAAVAKQRLGMTHDEALDVVQALVAFPICPVTGDLVIEAIAIKTKFGISYWDAAILAAAKQLRCSTVYSEDLNHGQDYDGVRVINPFIAPAATAA